jgi:precorrin-6B C5,15-methyltransferase / cobalt-precorrin-6B C5,C15-methyltransferase
VSAALEPWLHVVGIGDAGSGSLGAAALAAIEAAEVLVGGERHLAMVPGHAGERLRWRRPLAATLPELEALRGRRVVVLASGDPMWFGVGELLARHFGPGELRVLPAPSTFSLVCARLGWPLAEVACLSAHGRPLSALRRHLAPGARLIVLSGDSATPPAIAQLLTDLGFGASRLWVFVRLEGPDERMAEGTAAAWPGDSLAALNTVAIACAAGPGTAVHATAPGLPDEAFEFDEGTLTKREVRAATLARLSPLPGQRLWDVGAGSGAVSIEWLRAAGRGQAIAVEQDPRRCAVIARNADRLGTPELTVVPGQAPQCLRDLPTPDAVFIGGGLSEPLMIETCWRCLRSGGRLVANVVSVEGERRLLDWQAGHGGELTRIDVARLDTLGRYQVWRPALAVTQLASRKP